MNKPEDQSLGKPARGTVVWIAVMVVTVGALILLVLAWGHWWPAGTDWYLVAAIAVAILVAAGAVWANSSMYVLWKRRRWAWWMLTWPIVTTLGVAQALAARPEFTDARPQFEAIARQLLGTPGPTSRQDFTIGRFEIRTAYDTSHGEVFFSDKRKTMFTTESGWVYSSDGGPPDPPSRDGEFTTDHLDGPWYRYRLVMNF